MYSWPMVADAEEAAANCSRVSWDIVESTLAADRSLRLLFRATLSITLDHAHLLASGSRAKALGRLPFCRRAVAEDASAVRPSAV